MWFNEVHLNKRIKTTGYSAYFAITSQSELIGASKKVRYYNIIIKKRQIQIGNAPVYWISIFKRFIFFESILEPQVPPGAIHIQPLGGCAFYNIFIDSPLYFMQSGNAISRKSNRKINFV